MKRNFEATEGLLHDVMRKQAGSIEKAVLEAVMNSVDADASEITIDISEERVTVEDDGKGMTEEEIEEYFQKFGLKDDDIEEKEFGKFRMGRGQIFNFGQNIWHTNENLLLIDLNNADSLIHEDLVGDINEEDINGRDGSHLIIDTEGLSYHILNASTVVDGVRIEVNLYNPIEYVGEKVTEVKDLIEYISWLHDVEISINGEKIYNEPEEYEETDLAYHTFDSGKWSSRTSIYNKGAYVKRADLDNTGGELITKHDLDVNFARNDILETDQIFEQAVEQRHELLAQKLLNEDDLDKREKNWLIQFATEKPDIENQLSNRPLVEDITGESWTLEQLQNERISFAKEGDARAQDAMEFTGTIFIDKDMQEGLEGLFNSSQFVEYREVIDEDMGFEMSEVSDEELSSKRLKNLKRARYFLDQVGFFEEVNAGHSKHANVWKDTDGAVYLDRSFLNKNKEEFLTDGLIKILEIAAHDGDTMEGIEHSFSFGNDFWKYSKNMGEPQRKLLNGTADLSTY